jgi:manganese/zinc/iron transport system substrate-binding protein
LVADVVRNVSGGRLEVVLLMGAGVDPHQYEPTPADARALKSADLVFYSGLHLEGNMGELLHKMGQRKPTIALAESLEPAALLKDGDGNADPHVWFDVALWARTADAVADALAKFDPEHADEYRDNARTYRKSLEKLDVWVRQELKPIEPKVLVTAHDAFRYFGRAYGFEVRGLQGISTVSEAGLKERRELAGFITRRKIKAIFVESSVPARSVEALREDCREAGHKVEIGGELFSDAMGAPGSGADTYEGMVRHNVRILVEALK